MIPSWFNQIGKKEIENYINAVNSHFVMEGPILKEFEDRVASMFGVKYSIGTNSGTAALCLSLMGLGIRPNDEVIVPDFTFIATANAANILGAKVVVAPVDKNTLTLDFSKVDEVITDKTKAIITVDLNGRISCSKAITEKYNKKGISIVTDACQSFSSKCDEGYAGTLTNLGCFSFGITKTVTTIQGGMVVTDDDELYEKMKIIKTQGMRSVFEGAYIYGGFNFKLPDVSAAIGLAQLDRLPEKKRNMNAIIDLYMSELINVEGLSSLPRNKNEFIWMPEIVCQNRDKVQKILSDNDIISRKLYEPLHTANFLYSPANYDDAADITGRILEIPGGPDQKIENINKVISVLKNHQLI